MSDNLKKMFQSLLGSLLNHPCLFTDKNFVGKPLFLVCITFVFSTIYSLNIGPIMEAFAIITVLNH